jgi:hypothetical protein
VLQANGADPVLQYSNLGATFLVDLLTGGEDRLVVYGNSTGETITMTPTAVTASGQVITYANAEALAVDGQEGSDTFNVTPSGTTEMFIDGGDPIGITGDRLVLTATSATDYAPGPEGDEGGFGFASTLPVSYDHIEGIAVDLATNSLDVAGTNGDDDIKVLGTGTTSYRLTVNDSPAIVVTNSGALTVDGLHGDDEIDIDVRGLGLSGLTVIGNNPSVAGDTLTVEGVVAGADNATWTPTAFDAGSFTVGAQTITVQTMERLVYDGEDEAENLTVVLPATAGNLAAFELDTFTFRGSVNVNRAGQPLLGIEFEDISAAGAVTINGAAGGADTLFYGGREEIDQIAVSNAGVITNAPLSIPVLTPGVEDLVLLGRNGNDVFAIASDHPYNSIIVTGDGSDAGATADANGDQVLVRGAARAETITVQPNPYIDSETYITGTGVNQARNISTSGVERIYYLGTGNDTLVVDPGQGTHSVRVDAGRFTGWPTQMPGPYDRVTSDSLPLVFGGNLETLRVAPAAGAPGNVAVTFVTGDLTEAANYEAVLGGDDTLVIEGADGQGDRHTVTRPAVGAVRVQDTLSGVVVTETSGALGRLQLNTLGGDDEVTVDVGGTALITVPITFDGGANSDTLQVQGTPTGGAVSATYRPGPAVTEGRLTWVNAATMTVDIVNLEPVLDLVPGTLTVQGTDADNVIDYRAGAVGRGLVSVDEFETIEFSNKTTLTLNGNAGNDVIHLNNGTTPTGLTGIAVAGGAPTLTGDALIVNGTQAAVLTVDVATGTITNAEPVPVTYSTIEGLTVQEGISTDLAVLGSADYTVNPGAETDQGQILSAGVPITFDGYGSGDQVQLTGTGAGVVTVNGTAANDTFTVATNTVTMTGRATITATALPTATLNAYAGEDVFNVNGNNTFTTLNVHGGDGDDDDALNVFNNAGAATVDLGARTVAGYGALINYTGLEAIDADVNAQNLTVNATAGDDTVAVTPLTGTSGVLQANGADPVLQYSNLGATFLVDLLTGGEDRLVVSGNSTSETITVTPTTVTASGQAITYANAEALAVDGREGSDTFNVTPSATTEVFVDGGDAIGVVGDTLIVVSTSATEFAPGPEGDEGGFSFASTLPVSYDHIEALELDLQTNSFDVSGTNGDDDIKVLGTGAASYRLSVNASPAIVVTNSGALTVDGLHGDDEIDIDVRGLGLSGLTVIGNNPSVAGDTLTVEGVVAGADNATWTPTAFDAGSFTVGAQTITVQTMERLVYDGEDEAENLTVVLPATAGNLAAFELDTFTFRGSVNVNRAGQPLLGIEFEDISAAGAVTINGAAGGADTLFYGGREEIDQIAVSNAGVITNAPLSIPVLTPGVEDLVLLGRNGNDVFAIASDHPYNSIIVTGDGSDAGATADANGDQVLVRGAARAETITVQPNPYIDSETYITGTGVNQARNISTSGVERIYYLGTGNDTLVVDPGQGTHSVRVDAGRFTGWPTQMPGPYDRVTSDSLPLVFGGNLETLRVAPAAGAPGNVAVTFVTGDLTEAANYEAVLGGDDTLVIEGADGQGDRHTVTRPAVGAVRVQDTLSGVVVTETSGALGRLQLNTLGGDDVVTVDDSTGLISPLITVDGGTGSDALVVLGTVPVEQVEYLPGPAVTEGRLTYDTNWRLPGKDMTIDFVNLEPVIDLVPKTVALTVYGTNADNAINYVAGPHSGVVDALFNPAGLVTGSISVDAYETLEFANFTGADDVLEIISLAGDDVVNLNYQGAVAPSGLERIWVEGNDPTASDVVIVNGTVALDTIGFSPTAADAAVVTGVQRVTRVDIRTAESVVINGLGGSDTLTTTTPAGASTVTLIPGSTRDSGSVQVDSLVPMDFTNLGVGAASQVLLADADANDTFVYLGTEANDAFTVAAAGTVKLNGHVLVDPSQAAVLTVKGLDGQDVFAVSGGAAYTTVNVEADGPDTGDVLNATTPTGAVTVNLGAATITGYVGTINYSGLETIDADAGLAAMNVVATAEDDDVTVTVWDANSGTVQLGLAVQQNGQVQGDSVDPLIIYRNTGGNAVAVNLSGGEDALVVVGNAFSQTFNVDVPAGSVTVDDGNNASIDGTVTWTGNESLAVFGLESDDTFNVVAGAIPVFIDGGDPIGQTPGDRFNIVTGGGPVVFEAGPEPDEGGIRVGSNARISYDHIEGGQVTNFNCAVVMGTNGDDDITIIARTELTNPLRYATADGNKDFTSSVNDGIEILWINNNPANATVNLYVDALAGDDDVVFRTPALDPVSGAPIAWNVNAWVVGGTPSAKTGDQGDVLELETPGPTSVQYQPLTSETGTLSVNTTSNLGGPYDTTIHLVQSFVVDCNKDGTNEYASSEGGFEELVYDGEATNDRLTVRDTQADDVIVHTPGVGRDEGTIRVSETLALTYQNLGLGATLTVEANQGGNDKLVVQGTALSDAFTVDRTAVATGRIRLNDQLPILNSGVETYTLNGLDGDDRFWVNLPLATGVSLVNVNGSGPAGSDAIYIAGETGAAEDFVVTPSLQPGMGVVSITGSASVAVNYTGTEHLFLEGNRPEDDDLTIYDDGRDNVWTVSHGTQGDLVQIEGRESFEFRTFVDVTLSNNFGTDLFRILPSNLTGFVTLTVVGDTSLPVDDVLEIVGTPGNDVVTSNATTVTTNGVPVTAGANLVEIQVNTLAGDDNIDLDLNLAGYRKVVDAGAGNDTVDVSGMQDATIFGGAGDDNITGSPLADLIYGGSGNDIILGLGADDTIYGDEGNDTITGGPGNDRLFGGDGSDRFIWNNGDGSDVVEGDEGVDVQVVNGAATGDNFVLRTKTGDQTRAFLERTNLTPFSIDMGKVEQVDINGLAGADTVEVQDLYTTNMWQVNVDVGAQADTDAVTVQGRTVADEVWLAALAGGVVNIAGLSYDVNVANLNSVTDADTLTLNGNAGDDVISAADGLNAIFGVTLANVDHLILNGGEGDDSISGFGQLNGNAGDDVLRGGDWPQTITGGDGADQLYGGGGGDMLDGGAGEDLLVGGPGADTINGGDTAGNMEYDTILVSGTSGNDTIDVYQTSATSVTYRVNADTQTDTLVLVNGDRTVDEIRIEAGSGADLIRVRIADALAVDGNVNALIVNVLGGAATSAGDRLIVLDDTVDDLTLYRKGLTDDAGTVSVGPANAESFETVFAGIERLDFLDVTAAGVVGGPVNALPGHANRLVVFKHDPYEYNDDLFTATHLGANDATNVDPTIDPGAILFPFDNSTIPGDADWYRLEAEVTGTLDVQAFFEEIPTIVSSGRPGLPGAGNLDIELYDVDGTLIAGYGPNFGRNDGPAELNVDSDQFQENERIRIPAVAGQVYYLRVASHVNAAGQDVGAVNNYALTVVNEAPSTPWGLELNDHVNLLSGLQEVPPVTTTANGQVIFAYNDAANTFDIDIFASGIELADTTVLPQLTGAHIRLGNPGAVGAVIVDLGLASWVQEENGIRLQLSGVAFPAANEAALESNGTYVNLETSANATGQLRAQLTHIVEMSDSGRTNWDNVTHDNTPTIYFRLDDAIFANDQPGNNYTTLPFDEVIPIPLNTQTIDAPSAALTAGYRVAVFDEGPEPWAENPQDPIGYATLYAPGVYVFTPRVALADGSHFLTARVQLIDPASVSDAGGADMPATGWGARSLPLEINVDTVIPPAAFGLVSDPSDGLHPDSDTGVPWQPESHDDNYTADTTPTFWGMAEADTIIRLYVDVDADGAVERGTDFFIGETVALPLDGNDQFPNGQWELTSVVDMNDDDLLAALVASGQLQAGETGGVRHILGSVEDLAGNVTGPDHPFELDIFIDTQGPRVYDPPGVANAVHITDNPATAENEAAHNLFDPKASEAGHTPTPLVYGLTVHIEDLPDRVVGFLQAALKTHPEAADPTTGVPVGPVPLEIAYFSVAGDFNGIIPIAGVNFTSNLVVAGQPATGYIEISFANPLPDDRFTLTVHDDLMDYAGNRLDGEMNTAEPHEYGDYQWPSGDGIPGGDFVARFTVDSRPEIATTASGSVWVDTNGNFTFDPDNADYTNRDITYVLGVTTDDVFAGNFSGPGPDGVYGTADDRAAAAGNAIADGFDKLAVYGRIGGSFRWLIDTDNDGVPNPPTGIIQPAISGKLLNGMPVAGNFDGNAANGDEVGLLMGNTWYVDTNHDFVVDAALTTQLTGYPIVGDFDGNGVDDLATWKADKFSILLNPAMPPSFGAASNLSAPATIQFGFIGTRERPVAADMDQDGIDDLGLWTPDLAGVAPEEGGEWYFLITNAFGTDKTAHYGSVYYLDHPFEPIPFGHDLYAMYGDEFAVPVVGNFDPPVVVQQPDLPFGYTNLVDPADVNGDLKVTPLDVLLLINSINSGGMRQLQGMATAAPYLDPNDDMRLTPADVLYVINTINGRAARASSTAGGEGEAAAAALGTLVVDVGVPAAVPVAAPAALPATSPTQPADSVAVWAEQSPASVKLDDVLVDLATDVARANDRGEFEALDQLFGELGG